MFLNLLRRYHYFVVYSVATPEAEKDSKLAEESVKRLNELRDQKQYQKYLSNLVNQGAVNTKLNFLNPKVHKFVESYFSKRGRVIDYFEPCAGQTALTTFAVYGTAGVQNGKLNRNILIFLLELFASIKEPSKCQVTADFPSTKKIIDNIEITIYKIRKHGK